MRYYNIVLTDAAGGQAARQFTSFVGGQSIAGALNVELDIPVAPFATPSGDAYVRIWGISLADIAQASDLNNKAIAVYGGMQKGLPLANPAQAGLLVRGYVFQAFGNWIGTDQTLDLVIRAGSPPTASAGSAQPAQRNVILLWPAGTSLANALKVTLSTAYPGYTIEVNISASLVRPNDVVGVYPDLTTFAQYIKQATQAILGGAYAGVDILLTDKTISVYDGTSTSAGSSTGKAANTQIAFQDLIGQPTWIEPAKINFKCVMRADLKVGDTVTMPPTLTTNSAQAQSSLLNQKATFQGGFQIVDLRHVGNFRQPDAASWVTVIDAAALAPVNA